MKKVLLILILAGTFLLGYDVGRQPGSPDLVGHAIGTLRWIGRAGRRLGGESADRGGDRGGQSPDHASPIVSSMRR